MQNISVDKFRVFQDRQDFELRTFTFLTGKNNSGKSTLIKALLILHDYLNQEDQTYLEYNGEYFSKHLLSSFENTLNSKAERKELSLGFLRERVEYSFSFYYDEKDDKTVLSNFTIQGRNRPYIALSLKRSGKEFLLSTRLNALDELFGHGYQGHIESIADSAISIHDQISKLDQRLQNRIIKILLNAERLHFSPVDLLEIYYKE